MRGSFTVAKLAQGLPNNSSDDPGEWGPEGSLIDKTGRSIAFQMRGKGVVIVIVLLTLKPTQLYTSTALG